MSFMLYREGHDGKSARRDATWYGRVAVVLEHGAVRRALVYWRPRHYRL
jgi:hypothetical protein